MSLIQVLGFATSLVAVVGGLVYLLELEDPRRHWALSVAVLVPVVALIVLAIRPG